MNIQIKNACFSLAETLHPIANRRTGGALAEGGATGVLALLIHQGIHEFYAESCADAATVNGFGLSAALSLSSGLNLVWIVHDRGGLESGQPYGEGLHDMGVAPGTVLVVRARDIRSLLSAGEDALRTRKVGTVLLSAWGEDRAFSLTASRRLSLAARDGGKRLFLARAGAAPQPSAAESRWSVRSAASTPLAGGAPGRPAFSATLLRNRAGAALGTWMMEWDREGRSFVEPAALSGGVAAMAGHRPFGAAGGGRRHA
ncbi:ImuA family protein [Brevundimonas sp.]|uniref:ImuA family protein n=1 Tax=Brevundimonas sp. TaxID=1871086 RepID=UPI00391B20E0